MVGSVRGGGVGFRRNPCIAAGRVDGPGKQLNCNGREDVKIFLLKSSADHKAGLKATLEGRPAVSSPSNHTAFGWVGERLSEAK